MPSRDPLEEHSAPVSAEHRSSFPPERKASDAIERAIDAIDRWLSSTGRDGDDGYSLAYAQRLAVLRALIEEDDALIRPERDPASPLGHRYGWVEEVLEIAPGEGREVLEDLADKGLLQRELHNWVHTCPSCRTWHVNFRETCPFCGSIDLDLERLIHHFPCAYVGLESEFQQGFGLTCPKCSKPLQELGQDFERPQDSYVCAASEDLFEAPVLEGECLNCGESSRADELLRVPLHGFRPTELTVRAVELGRLTGLDIHELLWDSQARLHTREFFEIEVERELLRLRRSGGRFTTGVLSFRGPLGTCPIFREWPERTLRRLAVLVAESIRELDLIARLDSGRIAVLLIDSEDVTAVGERLQEALADYGFRSSHGHDLTSHWEARGWEAENTPSDVRSFLDASVEPSSEDAA